MALKSARIVEFCGKSSGLADFENTVDRGSAVIFGVDSGLCLSYVRILGPKRNLDHIEITSWKARAYEIFTRVGEVSEIERVSAANE